MAWKTINQNRPHKFRLISSSGLLIDSVMMSRDRGELFALADAELIIMMVMMVLLLLPLTIMIIVISCGTFEGNAIVALLKGQVKLLHGC